MNRWRRFMTQLHRAVHRKRDDRGSAIVIVIIAMAMIGVLATTMVWMSYMNYMIKVNDIKNKNSFYSAEVVVEQILAGLQNTSSQAVGTAYSDMVAKWDSLGSEENRYSEFATNYMDNLVELLKSPTMGTGFYDRDTLKGYIDASLFDASSATSGVDVTAWNNGGTGGYKAPTLEKVNDNSLILHDIYVSFTDGNGLVSIVQTDICIDVPKLVFTHNEAPDKIYEYVLVGNEGIEVEPGNGTLNTEGSVYAGTDSHDKGGLIVNAASRLVMRDAKNVISRGDIRLLGPAAGLSVSETAGKDNSVYARNIYLDSGAVSLDSSTYVANDLSLNGNGSMATLTKDYYGYGASANNGLTGEPPIDSNASSAIIINGKDSAIDMSGVKRLMLAGRAYIGQSSTGAEAAYNQAQIEAGLMPAGEPVMMGESIAVKGGQIAYLVPAECIGTMDGETLYGHNPISGAKESDLQLDKATYGDLFYEVDFNKKVFKLGNKSLSEFGVTDMTNIRKVFAQYKGDTLVYYYLVMDKANAEKYFVQYYDFTASKSVLDGYFAKYASGGILLGDYAASTNEYTILGNSLVSDALTAGGSALLTSIDQTTIVPPAGGAGGTGGTGTAEGSGAPVLPADELQEVEEHATDVSASQHQTEAEVTAQAAAIANRYLALTTNLSEDASTIGVGQNVFNSLIKETDVDAYLTNHGVNKMQFYTEISEAGVKSGLQAYVTREPDLNVSSLSNDVRLIISMGNVHVDKNFRGLIIAKGKVTIGGGVADVKRDKMGLYKALNGLSGETGDTITPLDMFVDGSGSMVSGATDARVDDAGNLQINYSEIVRYMNWIKK